MCRVLLSLLIALCLGGLYPAQTAWAQEGNAKVLADIRSAYDGLDFPVAEARIETALENFERFLPAELTEIHVVYALILFARNDLAGAREQFGQALQLSPSLTLDPVDTPPQLLAVFDELKADYAREAGEAGGEAEIRYLVLQDPRASAALRSMVVPGWGQLYKGERKKGFVLAGLWTLTAGGTLVAHLSRQQARDLYLDATTQAQALDRFQDYSTWHKVRNNFLLGAVGVWAYSYLDAILRGNPMPAPATGLQVSLLPAPTNPTLSLNFNF